MTAGIGCRQEMYDQPKVEPFEASVMFPAQSSQRETVPGTVARGELHEDHHLNAGRIAGDFAGSFPFEIGLRDIERGRERFDIYCAPCHGRTGVGNGMIVQRGFRRPPSFHEARIRDLAPGYLFDVITNGYATMPLYGDRIAPDDRWRIVAYIRALQRGTDGRLADVPPDARKALSNP